MGVARISGVVPGANSLALAERRARAVTAGLSTAHPIFIASADGATVTDVDGNTFIDFTSGIGVMNVGHARPEVVQAIGAAAGMLTHAAFQVAGYESYVAVAEKLCAIAPIDGERRALLMSTGAEAVENAIKIARSFTGRAGVLCFEHAFHGRTLLGMSLTGKTVPYKSGFGPFAPEIYRLPYPYAYRNLGMGPWDFDRMLQTIVNPHDLAAVIIEPVLGEGGFMTPPDAFWPSLRAFCDRHGIVLILDEIQSGFGRTGTMFASEQIGIAPDAITVAKSIAGGMPLSAVVGRAGMMDAVPKGGVGGTYSGNPVACAAALAAMSIIEQEIVGSGRAAQIGERMRASLTSLAAESPLVGEVRGLGAMLAIELVHDRRTREPAADRAQAVIASARNQGLLLLAAGSYGNVIRFLPPLTIDDAVLDEGLAIVDVAVRDAAEPIPS
jgi:4-aminobutyrate aminotransferase/(S)-3-amino-2-methylpropionate transaminase